MQGEGGVKCKNLGEPCPGHGDQLSPAETSPPAAVARQKRRRRQRWSLMFRDHGDSPANPRSSLVHTDTRRSSQCLHRAPGNLPHAFPSRCHSEPVSPERGPPSQSCLAGVSGCYRQSHLKATALGLKEQTVGSRNVVDTVTWPARVSPP